VGEQQKITLLLADDQTILRQGLRRILEGEPDIAVIGEAATGPEAVQQAKQLKPDVVIMDISMPEEDGIETIRQILKNPGCRVVILTVHLDREVISEAVMAGASGYLSKDSPDHELLSAVRTIMGGGRVFSANVLRCLAGSAYAEPTTGSIKSLTSREREVLVLLSEGKSSSEVAKSLCLSPKTIQKHRRRVMEKLRLKTTAQLIHFALHNGLIKTI
jgi:DNA-binding NarL/FixJ family response regulator